MCSTGLKKLCSYLHSSRDVGAGWLMLWGDQWRWKTEGFFFFFLSLFQCFRQKVDRAAAPLRKISLFLMRVLFDRGTREGLFVRPVYKGQINSPPPVALLIYSFIYINQTASSFYSYDVSIVHDSSGSLRSTYMGRKISSRRDKSRYICVFKDSEVWLCSLLNDPMNVPRQIYRHLLCI